MSFYAVIVACHMLAPDQCLTIIDNRGPYQTVKRCEERMVEMVGDLSVFWIEQEMPMGYRSMECIDKKPKKGTAT